MPGANTFSIKALGKSLKPFRLHFFTRLKSTNEYASRLRRKDKLFAPALVLAGNQIAGKGRGKNTWWSGKGSITVTFVVPSDPRILPHQVPIIAGLAVHRTASKLIGKSDIKLKWPNDLLHDDLKLAGLLCERLNGVDLIGIGLNVNVNLTDIPSKLRHRCSSLSAIIGREIVLNDALTTLTGEIAKLLLQKDFGSFSQILREYGQHDGLKHRAVSISDPGQPVIQGICQGLDSEGRLLVKTPDQIVKLVSGHVELS